MNMRMNHYLYISKESTTIKHSECVHLLSLLTEIERDLVSYGYFECSLKDTSKSNALF
jgi:hypothetical protein